MRKLLILTAIYTGHGHKSISDALMERLKKYDDIEVRAIDGFDLMTRVQRNVAEKTYGPITRMPAGIWKWSYAAGMAFMAPMTKTISMLIEHKFRKLMDEFQPDCILSVHPMFLGSIIDLMENMGKRVPFVAHEADLIDIARYWFDPRIDLLLCPSKESYDCSIQHGAIPEHTRQVGFPVRSRFYAPDLKPKEGLGNPVKVTVMSGSEGSGVLKNVVRELLRKTDCEVNVVCGRNKAIRKKLRKAYGTKYHSRFNALGFIERIEKVMNESDILILRASPNSVMEAVALRKPVILFGQLAGQEQHNPDMMEAHGIAVRCTTPEELPARINELLANDGEKIQRMCSDQRAYQPTDAAEETAALLNDFIRPQSGN